MPPPAGGCTASETDRVRVGRRRAFVPRSVEMKPDQAVLIFLSYFSAPPLTDLASDAWRREGGALRLQKSAKMHSTMSGASFSFASSIQLLTFRRSSHFARQSRCVRRHAAGPMRPSASLHATAPPASTKAQPAATPSSLTKYLNSGLGVVVLKRGKGRFFRQSRPSMVFSGAVASTIPPSSGSLSTADPVVVVDGVYSMIGYGFFNPTSIFQVRLLRHGVLDAFDVEGDIRRRLSDAYALRKSLGFPNEATDAFRVVNGEGDRLSGLVVDFYANNLVVSSSAAWVERYRGEIERGLAAVVPANARIVWRRSIDRLRQDGYTDEPKDETAEHAEVPDEESMSAGIVALENGIRYNLPLRTLHSGQKTGHYTDQRDARFFLHNLLATRPDGKDPPRVLDLFSYTGAFGLAASLAGATSVCVDSSARAIELGSENARLNGVSDRIEFVRSDIGKFLESHSRDELYDVVIADPPKMAPNAKALQRATRKYRSLNAGAIKRVRPGGFLLTCSCSAAVARERGLFVDIVSKAAADVGRDVALLKSFGSAADHPVAPDAIDGDYLTACLFICH